MLFSSIEVDFFNRIKNYVSIVFDVGSRDDIDYIKNSDDKSRQFHLFDPDPKFIKSCQEQINELKFPEGVDNSVYLNAFGLGVEEGELFYYPNTQSFVFRTHHAQSSGDKIKYPIKTLDDYCVKNSIEKIDFLKLDVEGVEIDVLNGGKNIINNSTNIIQFEFVSAMLDRETDPDEYVAWFDKDVFDLYLQKLHPIHPMYSKEQKMLTYLDDELYEEVKTKMKQAHGCNLIAVRKNISKEICNVSNA